QLRRLQQAEAIGLDMEISWWQFTHFRPQGRLKKSKRCRRARSQRRDCPEFRVWSGLTSCSVRSPLDIEEACGRCGKPRAVRFSKERWTRSVRPPRRQCPCALAFYALDGEKRPSYRIAN